MNSKSSESIRWLGYLVLVIWIVNGIFVIFLLGRIDTIVHGDLYNFGLQFSYEWANHYWESVQLIYALLGLPMILSLIVLSVALLRARKRPLNLKITNKSETETNGSHARNGKIEETTLAIEHEALADQERLQAGTLVEPVLIEPSVVLDAKKTSENTNWCPNCGKVFSKPMVMLDFVGGKTRLVNVCPYCSHILGEAMG